MGSVLVAAGWMVFILIYALDWSRSYDLFQNIIVTITSVVIAVLLVGGVRLVWYRPNVELRRISNKQ